MSQSFYGSVCLTDMIEQAKKKHSAFTKAQNGKIYCNITTWLNDQEDKFGNVVSIQASSQKEMVGKEDKFYLGNCKKSKVQEIKQDDFAGAGDFDIPARETQTQQSGEIKSPADDLPF